MSISDEDLEGLEMEKRPGRVRDQRVLVLMSLAEVMRLDEWRRAQPDLPPRSEGMRRLMVLGLKAAKGR
jgi:hypothetical protein